MFKGLIKSESTAQEIETNLNYKSLDERETKEVITPFAFKVNQKLFGLPLASPMKRAIAFSLDFIFIAMLSSAGGEVLAIGIAIMFYRMSSRKMLAVEVSEDSSESELQSKKKRPGKPRGRKRRAFYRLVASFIIFVMLTDFLPPLFKSIENFGSDEPNKQQVATTNVGGEELNFAESMVLAGVITDLTVELGSSEGCADLGCWREKFESVPSDLAITNISAQKFESVVEGLVEVTELSQGDKTLLIDELVAKFAMISEPETLVSSNQEAEQKVASELKEQVDSPNEPPALDRGKAVPEVAKVEEQNAEETPTEKSTSKIEEEERTVANSITSFIMGFIEEDLGIGLGWAAFYYTVFTSWWRGKTPGKHLVGIKVVQLDGTDLSVWESFERQGGYAAGLATGLLGFLQVYWDPNRQAIHDKISETVVIDVKRLNRLKAIEKSKE